MLSNMLHTNLWYKLCLLSLYYTLMLIYIIILIHSFIRFNAYIEYYSLWGFKCRQDFENVCGYVSRIWKFWNSKLGMNVDSAECLAKVSVESHYSQVGSGVRKWRGCLRREVGCGLWVVKRSRGMWTRVGLCWGWWRWVVWEGPGENERRGDAPENFEGEWERCWESRNSHAGKFARVTLCAYVRRKPPLYKSRVIAFWFLCRNNVTDSNVWQSYENRWRRWCFLICIFEYIYSKKIFEPSNSYIHYSQGMLLYDFFQNVCHLSKNWNRKFQITNLLKYTYIYYISRNWFYRF